MWTTSNTNHFVLSLYLYEFQRFVISVDDSFLSQNIMLKLLESLRNRVHLLIIGGIHTKNIKERLTMTCHLMSILSEDCTDNIVEGIYLELK